MVLKRDAVKNRKGQPASSSKKKKKNASVKSQIRSLQRVLAKGTATQRDRKALEGRMEALRRVYEDHKRAEKEKQMATRYHRIKFFERVKLERRMETLKKDVARAGLSEQERSAAATRLEQCTLDLQYVLHFPKAEKYVSLLKNATDPEAQEALQRERNRLRLLVAQRIADDHMLSEMNEGTQHPILKDSAAAHSPDQSQAKPVDLAVMDGKLGASRLTMHDAMRPSKKAKRKSHGEDADTADQQEEKDDFFLDEDQSSDSPLIFELELADQALLPVPENRKSGRSTSSGAAKSRGQNRTDRVHRLERAKPQLGKFEEERKILQDSNIDKGEIPVKRTRAEGGRKRRKKHK